ncbi:hypothetical protein FA13DRAFT_1775481 [Coprinellus micaceus]|uniref:G domain-containing protein n=1 Tax=Coprinellus micaceus TaxID=71717 RepID=A0A4Y7T6B7_COPMI|nr:hypothetical protein FA13DRAFT_1775481 [Coprinellus micaceus]
MAWATFYHKSFQDFLCDSQRWRVHFGELDDEVAKRWLTDSTAEIGHSRYAILNLVAGEKSPEMPLHDPYYLDVFNVLAPLYWRALTSTSPSPSLFTGKKSKPNQKRKSSELPQVFRGSESDIIILVLGNPGSGKSTLVNRLVGWNQVTAQSKQGSRTKHVQVATVRCAPRQYTELNNALEGCRIVLVEPYEFDEGDYEGLAHLVRWLEATYRCGMAVRGILYLHDVSQTAERRKTRRSNLSLLSQLCGENALDKVALVSTRWETVHPDIFEERLRSLVGLSLGGGLWAPMVTGGTSVHHLRPAFNHDVSASLQHPLAMQEAWDPWRIIAPFLTDLEASRRPLLVQDELVNRNLPFERTAVGRTLGTVPKGIFSDVGGSAREHRLEGGMTGTRFKTGRVYECCRALGLSINEGLIQLLEQARLASRRG